MIVRDAMPADFPAIGALRIAAYRAGGFLSDDSHYTDTLRVLGADGSGQVLTAADEPGPADGTAPDGSPEAQLLGTVMLQLWPNGQLARSAAEAEIRALAVHPRARGRGVGRALLRAAANRAAAAGASSLVLSTQPAMLAAQHLYTQDGFRRLPERDWCPVPGFTLLAYGRALATS